LNLFFFFVRWLNTQPKLGISAAVRLHKENSNSLQSLDKENVPCPDASSFHNQENAHDQFDEGEDVLAATPPIKKVNFQFLFDFH